MVYETDSSGAWKLDKAGRPIYSPVMKRLEQEGRTPLKVKETLDQIFSDARVGQQLDISGQYEYRGYSPDMLASRITRQKDEILSKYEDELNNLALQKGTGKNVQAQIDALELKKNNLSSQYDDFINIAKDNPDAIRSLLYKDDVKNRFTTMFGEMKTKETVMSNPGWEANFKLQKEINDQIQWAKGMAWDVRKHKDMLNEKEKDRNLQVLLKQMGISGKGDGLDSDYETADRAGNVNLVAGFESDLTNAAENVSSASDNFIWNASLSKLPENQAKLNSMLNQGMNQDQAIKILIDNAAARGKQTPENFRAIMSDKSTVAYNNMTAQERRNNPDLEDAYQLYKATRRNFDGLNTIKKKAESDVASTSKEDVSIGGSLTGVKTVGGVINGKPVTVTPEDFYDIAVYLKGNSSSLGFLNDKSAREAAKNAEARMEQKGKKELLSLALLQYGDAPDVTTGVIRSAKMLGNLALNRSLVPGTGAIPGVDLSQVNKVVNKLGDNFAGTLQAKADALKKYLYETPNLKKGLVTGEPKVDKVIADRLAIYAGNYNTAGKNASTDFSTFASNVGGKDVTYEAQVMRGAGGKPVVEVVAYGSGENNKRLGGMTLSDEEAARIGVNVEGLYEPESVRNLKMYIQANGDKTSKGDPKEKQTYIQGDSYFEKIDFPNLRTSNYDAKANITYKNGLYYSNIYATDGNRSGLMTMPGVPDIRSAIQGFNTISPQWVEALLKEQNNGR